MISISGREISADQPPYVIAELSGNHNGNIQRALELLALAKKNGADAVKIQTYRPDTMTIDCDKEDFRVKGGLWDGKTLYQLYQWAHTPWEWHRALFEGARELGITLFSSPFDESAVDFLEELNAPAYKVASFEMTDLPLVKRVAETGKPVIISTGMATFDEIAETVETVFETGNRQLVLLHCVSSYPAKHTEANLKTIPELQKRFGVQVGLSDHTLSNVTSISSVALGAAVIEKHFTDSRECEGPDSAFSIEPNELSDLVRDCRHAWESCGHIKQAPSVGEQGSLVFRRSVYVVEDIKKGALFSEKNIRRIRPGYGVAPKFHALLLGKAAPQDLRRGDPVTDEVLEQTGIRLHR